HSRPPDAVRPWKAWNDLYGNREDRGARKNRTLIKTELPQEEDFFLRQPSFCNREIFCQSVKRLSCMEFFQVCFAVKKN
ncbi:MAG: hypothetical protein J6N99_10545, partial [Schwartzia sp.]|nr:hypothetical protein [Schwartzia sp. (in: firmicutes)]